MKRIVLLLVSLFAVFLSTAAAQRRREACHQVAQAKDDALKLRQQLAQPSPAPMPKTCASRS